MTNRSVAAGGGISQGIVVTGDGNSVSLRFGESDFSLALNRKQVPPPPRGTGGGTRELDILVPETSPLPLFGRKMELGALQAWLDADADISVHALTGPAGTGKTRLAIGLCESVDGGKKAGNAWLAGFLRSSDLSRLADISATQAYDWPRPTLLVIDYAAEGEKALGRWLDTLAQRELPEGSKLRILLLERQAQEGFGWWHNLSASPLNDAGARRGLFYQPRPTELEGLHDPAFRRSLLQEALAAHARLHGDAAPLALPDPGTDAGFEARLGAAQFANPLALVMAGVIARDKGISAALALRQLDAARHLAQREIARLERRVDTDAEKAALTHLLAFNGMAGGLALNGLPGTLQQELGQIGATADPGSLAKLLQEELIPYGADQPSRLTTIQPDLIGEAVIVEAFEAPPHRRHEAAPAMQRAYALTGRAAAEALMRLLQDYAYARIDPSARESDRATAERLLTWLDTLADSLDTPEALTPLAEALPTDTLVLRDHAAAITGRLAQAYGAVLEQGGEISEAELHRAMVWIGNHATKLYALGDLEGAYDAGQNEVRIARFLFEREPDIFRDDLAGALNNFANHLSAFGRREDALAAAKEAVSLRRTLAEAQPVTFLPNLAGALNNLANALNDLGQREKALAAAQEAVTLYRTLAADRPDAFTPNLAASLNNLANSLSALGQHDAALAVADEAVTLYRALAADRPDSFIHDLAMSLNNRANRLSAVGQREKALAAAQEAVTLRRALAEARPDAFTPNFAISLNNLANSLSAVGKREAALAAAEEAVALFRALAAERPSTFSPDLAMSLNNQANHLSALGRCEEALAAAEEAVALRRNMSADQPDVFSLDLSITLGMYADIQMARGENGTALTAITEAITILAPIFRQSPQSVKRWMMMHLKRYFELCDALGVEPDEEIVGPVVLQLQKSVSANEID
ncbi:MAG: tetratricopeptide repeat protein [Salinarimonas sp.]